MSDRNIFKVTLGDKDFFYDPMKLQVEQEHIVSSMEDPDGSMKRFFEFFGNEDEKIEDPTAKRYRRSLLVESFKEIIPLFFKLFKLPELNMETGEGYTYEELLGVLTSWFDFQDDVKKNIDNLQNSPLSSDSTQNPPSEPSLTKDTSDSGATESVATPLPRSRSGMALRR
jgi:hypothetical protein